MYRAASFSLQKKHTNLNTFFINLSHLAQKLLSLIFTHLIKFTKNITQIVISTQARFLVKIGLSMDSTSWITDERDESEKKWIICQYRPEIFKGFYSA